jgi:hypothetical protein
MIALKEAAREHQYKCQRVREGLGQEEDGWRNYDKMQHSLGSDERP